MPPAVWPVELMASSWHPSCRIGGSLLNCTENEQAGTRSSESAPSSPVLHPLPFPSRSRLPSPTWGPGALSSAELSEGLVGSRCSVRKWRVSPSPRSSETRLLRICLSFAWALVSWRSEPSRSGLSLTSSRWSGRRCRWSSVTSGLAWSWSERPAPAPEATRWVQESLLPSMGVCVVPASPWEVSPQPEPRYTPCLPGPPKASGRLSGVSWVPREGTTKGWLPSYDA